MRTKYHGAGIYHNNAPDYNIAAYIAGKVGPDFVPGKILTMLRNGEYEILQRKNGFTTWFFESGHWDLRDTTLMAYEERLHELFSEFARFRDKFHGTATPLRLVWLGVPAFSFKQNAWGGMDMRTNVKLALADRAVADIAKEYRVEVLPFFDLTYPLYRQSCDSHHYICPVSKSRIFKDRNPFGYEFFKLVLEAGQCPP
mmetsp:Transcript_12675/g.23376  ORF Transcript_12675/g.23376 Transcript_12675/m.23376 type:complete len:199 (-) Transcript_12675:88-684(-)